MSKIVLAFLVVLTGAFAPAQAFDTADESQITYGCDDLVVVGRFNNLEYHPIEDEDDLLGHGIVDARVRVISVLRGPAKNIVKVRYASHAMFREGLDFLMVLKPLKGGWLWLEKARSTDHRYDSESAPPVLANHCK